MFQAGEDILVSLLASCPPVDYRRNATTVAGPRARIGHTHASTVSADGVAIHVRFTDFMILAADLPAGFVPAVGDVIRHGPLPYLVSAIDGEPCWAWHTRQSQRVLRIHTRLISSSHPAAGMQS